MKKNNTQLFKWMLGLVFTTVLLGLISQFAFHQTLQSDPEIVQKVETQLQTHFKNSNIHFDFDAEDSGPKETRVLHFALPVNQLTVGTTTGSISVVTNPKATEVTVTSHGRQRTNSDSSSQTPDNLSFKTADVIIEIPQNFTAPMKLKTVSGDIKSEELSCDTLEAIAVSGEIDLKNLASKKTMIHSVSGDVELHQKQPGELNINSISGEVELELASTDTGYKFDLKSVSGEVVNNFAMKSEGQTPVVVTTTSGDIEVK